MKPVVNGTYTKRKTVFSIKLLRILHICMKEEPAATEKISVLCCSVIGRFRCFSSHIPWNYALDSVKMSICIAFIQNVPTRAQDLKCAPFLFC